LTEKRAAMAATFKTAGRELTGDSPSPPPSHGGGEAIKLAMSHEGILAHCAARQACQLGDVGKGGLAFARLYVSQSFQSWVW
jgi:hypothetical protein